MRAQVVLNQSVFSAVMTQGAQPNIRRALIEIRSRAQAKFQLPKTGREYYRPRSVGGGKYRASAKGQAPAIRTGLLFRSWFVTQPSPLEGELKIDTPYAAILEFEKDRPFVRVSIAETIAAMNSGGRLASVL